MNNLYVPLHAHSAEGSIGDSFMETKAYITKAKNMGLKSLALTDHGSLSAAYSFYFECKKQGIKPIIGCEVYETKDRNKKEVREDYHLVLIAKDLKGFQNLLKITSNAHEEGYYYVPRTDLSYIKQHSKGLLALSGCVGGKIPQMILQNIDQDKIIEAIKEYQDIFQEDYYFEIQPGDFEDQRKVNTELLYYAQKLNIPIVATNDIHYLDLGDSPYHDCHVKIRRKEKIEDPMVYPDEIYYLMDEKEVYQKFIDIGLDKEASSTAIKNTEKIANKCNLNIPEKIHMPHFYKDKDEDIALVKLAYEKLNSISNTVEDLPKYSERLEYELSVIKQLGYSGYFLMVHDFIREAKAQDVAVGPGRGSAGGSLVSYVLGITVADPIKYDLLFERFLSPHRPGIPDIDLDFSSQDRYKMFLYAKEKYGHDHTCLVSTINYRKARSAIDDVARIMGINYNTAEAIKKHIPNVFYSEDGDKNADIDLDFALKNIPEIKKYQKKYPLLFDIGKKLENLPAFYSKHPAGVLINKDPLWDHIPIGRPDEKTGLAVTSLNLDDAESAGLT